jgi:DNA-binding GntR family transcriptional regulator
VAQEARLRELLDEQLRLNEWLQDQLERQRAVNTELRRAVADLARAFQESLAAAIEAGESGDLDAVRKITRANQQHWQAYLQQIVTAAQKRPDEGQSDSLTV